MHWFWEYFNFFFMMKETGVFNLSDLSGSWEIKALLSLYTVDDLSWLCVTYCCYIQDQRKCNKQINFCIFKIKCYLAQTRLVLSSHRQRLFGIVCVCLCDEFHVAWDKLHVCASLLFSLFPQACLKCATRDFRTSSLLRITSATWASELDRPWTGLVLSTFTSFLFLQTINRWAKAGFWFTLSLQNYSS